ncbi:hypothetical protein V7S43_015668 [Phytophthora oleae]|uniref:Crinkler effector protein N-terminal domain-containing protein n=1 Tax=Phytophthora oleae TaxID=2107226 RepID=A0ABD3EYQ7_9STRA
MIAKLFCAIVGVADSSFSVKIDEKKSVDELKNTIKEKKKNDLKDVDANNLQLFLARNGNTWLSSCAEGVKKLKKGENTALIEELTKEDQELQGESGLLNVLTGMEPPTTDQVLSEGENRRARQRGCTEGCLCGYLFV